MDAYKNIPIPVVDLHGYQMIYDCLGILWETSYVDTDNRIKFPLAKHQQFIQDSLHLYHLKKKKKESISFVSIFVFAVIHILGLASSSNFTECMFALVVLRFICFFSRTCAFNG